MTRDEIIAMAKQVGMWIPMGDHADEEITIRIIENFAAVVSRVAVEEEREALASLKADALDIFNNPPELTSQDVRDVIEWYDAAIRARGEK